MLLLKILQLNKKILVQEVNTYLKLHFIRLIYAGLLLFIWHTDSYFYLAVVVDVGAVVDVAVGALRPHCK